MSFKNSPVYVEVRNLLKDSNVINEMMHLSMKGIPAVQALDEPLWRALNGPLKHLRREHLDYTEKNQTGKLVRDAMYARGWRKYKSNAEVSGRLFSRGYVYTKDD